MLQPSRNKTVVLISIHKEYAEKIFSGEKQYELRKRLPELKKGDLIIVYVPKPEQRIEGWFVVDELIKDHPKKLWRRVSKKSGICRSDYNNYFENRSEGLAISIKKASVFESPISLEEFRKVEPSFYPPQSYIYLDNNKLEHFKTAGLT